MQSENKHGVMEWQGTEALVLPSFGKSLFAFLGEEKYFIHVCVCVCIPESWQFLQAYRLGMLEIKHSVSAPTARALARNLEMAWKCVDLAIICLNLSRNMSSLPEKSQN